MKPVVREKRKPSIVQWAIPSSLDRRLLRYLCHSSAPPHFMKKEGVMFPMVHMPPASQTWQASSHDPISGPGILVLKRKAQRARTCNTCKASLCYKANFKPLPSKGRYSRSTPHIGASGVIWLLNGHKQSKAQGSSTYFISLNLPF